MNRLFLTLRAFLFPILLGSCLLCMLLAAVTYILTPEGLNPGEAISLRVYLTLHDDELNKPYGTDSTQERFEVEAGDTSRTVGIKLVMQGIIANGTLFDRYMRYEGLDTGLHPGIFFISESMTIPEIATVLTSPQPTIIRFTIVEGWRMEQIAESIDATPEMPFTGNQFLAVAGEGASLPLVFTQKYNIPGGASLEGFLYPATYEIYLDDTALSFRDKVLQAFESNLTDQMLQSAALDGYTMFEVVTLASIVEREAVVPDERPIIADVFLSRLEQDEGLFADPTVQYGIGTTGNWWPGLSDPYAPQHEYNTYIHTGLPPGPIANPGIASIRAVIDPAETEYLYFVALCDGSGRHEFSVTLEEHNSRVNAIRETCQ